jgi:ribosomal protein S18 acetylase RimI-like enzyme
MPIQLIKPTPAHAPQIARILFDAFNSVCITHGHPTDFPSQDLALQVANMLISRPDFLGTLAIDSSRGVPSGTGVAPEVLGSNFAMVGDQVAGIGPITVDPACQSKGIGKLLMQEILSQCRAQGFTQIRLIQDAFNRASISLYARLGFVVQEPIADILTLPGAAPDPTIRPATLADIPALDALYQSHTGLSRKTELTVALQSTFPVLLRQRQSQITGYLIATIFGHGIAQTPDDALALAGQLANLAPEGNHFFVPLRNAELFQKALNLHMRTEKIMNLMTIGPYTPPTATWIPSIAY